VKKDQRQDKLICHSLKAT